jgi:hypothetical protein
MRRYTLLAVTAVCLVGGLGLPGTAAAAPLEPPNPPITVIPSDPNGRASAPSVGVGVRDRGAAGRTIDRGEVAGGRGGSSAAACMWVPAPDMEVWIRHLPQRLPSGGADRVDPESSLYTRVCGGAVQGYAWLGRAVAAVGAPVLPTPGELAQQAYAQLRLPVPTPEHSPDLQLADGRAVVLVGEQTWLWTDGSRFRAQSLRLRAGPVWALVTATPVGLSFDPGDDAPIVSCAGPGTAFVPGRDAGHAASPTCGYQYQRSSAGEPGGVVTAEYGITWRVRWTGCTGNAPAAGQLPDMTSRTSTSFAVAEAQALGAGGAHR